MKFRFSYDITLACGQYESALNLHFAMLSGTVQNVANRYLITGSSQ